MLKRLGPLLGRAAASAAIADTLVPVLALKRLDESAAAEVLGALAAVIPPRSDDMPEEDVANARDAAARHRSALAPLFGRLRSRTARLALCQAWSAVATHDGRRTRARGYSGVPRGREGSIDGVDYDAGWARTTSAPRSGSVPRRPRRSFRC